MLESQEIPGVTPIQQKVSLEADSIPHGAAFRRKSVSQSDLANNSASAPARLTNGKILVLEVKGQDDEQNKTKRGFLVEWVNAVNGHDGFGIWACDVSRHPKDVESILHRHNQA
jgi:hypothetical protein